MKKIFYFSLIMMLTFLPLISCGESKAEKEARIERERQDSIRIAQEREDALRKAEEERIERERLEQIERERQEKERTLNAIQGKYIFKDCYERKTFKSGFTYLGEYNSNNPQEYYDGYKKWDYEITVDNNNKVSIQMVNYREYDRNDRLIEQEDVAYNSGIIGEVVLLRKGVFMIDGKNITLVRGAKAKEGAGYDRGSAVVDECVFDNNENILYKSIYDFNNRNGWDDILQLPYIHQN